MGSSSAAIAAPSQRTELKSESFTHQPASPSSSALALAPPIDRWRHRAASASAPRGGGGGVAVASWRRGAGAAGASGAAASTSRGCSSTYLGLRLRCVTPWPWQWASAMSSWRSMVRTSSSGSLPGVINSGECAARQRDRGSEHAADELASATSARLGAKGRRAKPFQLSRACHAPVAQPRAAGPRPRRRAAASCAARPS